VATQDPSTQAVISALGSGQSFGASVDKETGSIPTPAVQAALAAIRAQDEMNRTELVNTVEFSYSSDIMQLGDPFSVVIPNPRGKYTNQFTRGQKVELSLKNPNVNGGQPTLKQRGVIVRRHQSTSSSGGSVIRLDCADLGWHLANNDAWLFYKLQGKPFSDLLQDPKFIDPSWGLTGLTTDRETTNLLKRGVNNGRAQYQLDLLALGTLVYLQIEPGDKVADIISTYARRINRLVNVGADGKLILWNPNYSKSALYHIELHDIDEMGGPGNPNNVIDAAIDEDITSIHTEVTCIGEIVGATLAPDVTDQNAAKRRGTFANAYALPFLHRLNFADGDIYAKNSAQKQAQWKYNRGIFDSWQAVYVVRGHHQGSEWWESDQMCTVNDTLHGISGAMYVSSVRYDRDSRGDRTTVTLRKPGLLQAAFGVLPMAPRLPGSVLDSSGTATSTPTTTAVTKPQRS